MIGYTQTTPPATESPSPFRAFPGGCVLAVRNGPGQRLGRSLWKIVAKTCVHEDGHQHQNYSIGAQVYDEALAGWDEVGTQEGLTKFIGELDKLKAAAKVAQQAIGQRVQEVDHWKSRFTEAKKSASIADTDNRAQLAQMLNDAQLHSQELANCRSTLERTQAELREARRLYGRASATIGRERASAARQRERARALETAGAAEKSASVPYFVTGLVDALSERPDGEQLLDDVTGVLGRALKTKLEMLTEVRTTRPSKCATGCRQVDGTWLHGRPHTCPDWMH